MIAAFQKQMRCLYGGLCGWVLLSLTLLATGLLSVNYHIIHYSSSLSSVTAILSELLILTAPVVAAFSFTEENKLQASPWLCSLPTSRLSLTVGSFLASLTVFVFPSLLLLLLPLLLSFLGEVSMESSYTAILGYFLFATALLAILSAVACCFSRKRVAILVGIGISLGIYLLPYLGSLLVDYPILSSVLLSLAAMGVCLPTLGVKRKKWLLAALLSVALTGVSFLLFWVFPAVCERFLPDLLGFFDLFGRASAFSTGHFDLSSCLLFLSMTVLFLFLTAALRPRPGIGAARFSPTRREGRVLAMLLAVSLTLQLGVLLLPFDLRYPTVSKSSVYTLSDTSKRYLQGLDADVELIYYSDGGEATADRDLYPFLLSIARQSERVSLRVEDLRGEDTNPADQSLCVRSERRSRYLSAAELYYYYNTYTGVSFTVADYAALMSHISSETDAETRAQLLATYSNGKTVGYFSGEGAIVNAIRYVLSPEAPRLVVMGEELNGTSAFLTRRLEESGYTVDRVDAIASIPADCNALFLHLTKDLTEGEAAALVAYLADGGEVLLTTSYSATDLPCLYGVLADFGLSASSEMNLLYHSQEGEAFAAVYADHPAAAGLSGDFYAYGAHAIQATEVEGVSLIPLLYTPSGVYNLTSENITDPSATMGSHLMGVTARRGEGSVTWISMPFDTVSEVVSSNGNFALAESIVDWLTLHTERSLSLSARALPSDALSVNDTLLIVWILLFAVLLPLLVLSVGLIRRRVRRGQ